MTRGTGTEPVCGPTRAVVQLGLLSDRPTERRRLRLRGAVADDDATPAALAHRLSLQAAKRSARTGFDFGPLICLRAKARKLNVDAPLRVNCQPEKTQNERKRKRLRLRNHHVVNQSWPCLSLKIETRRSRAGRSSDQSARRRQGHGDHGDAPPGRTLRWTGSRPRYRRVRQGVEAPNKEGRACSSLISLFLEMV
jgi:hypothetical protein